MDPHKLYCLKLGALCFIAGTAVYGAAIAVLYYCYR